MYYYKNCVALGSFTLPNIVFSIDPLKPSVLPTTSIGVRGLCFPSIIACYNTEPQQEFVFYHGQELRE